MAATPEEQTVALSAPAVTAAPPAPPAGAASSNPKPKKGLDLVALMAIIGPIWLVLTVAVAAIIVSLQDHTERDLTPTFQCQAILAGFPSGAFVEPWIPTSPQFVFSLFLVGLFVLRKYVFPRIVEALYPDLSEVKKIKCGNYMLELVGTTIGLVTTSWAGYWGLLFNGSSEMQSSEEAVSLGKGFNILFSAIVATYVLEICFDNHMRLGLMLHHWVSIVLSLWGSLMLYGVYYDEDMLRTVFAISLYAITEQSVFVEVLMYHYPLNAWVFYRVNAWFYLVTRVGIMVASLQAWWAARRVVWQDPIMYPTIAVSLWLFIPAANLILNITQYTTVVSLFGIAKTVEKRAKQRSEGKYRQLALTEVFHHLDFGMDHDLTLKEWRQHCEQLGWPIPKHIVEEVFNRMDRQGNGLVSDEDFFEFWTLLVMNTAPPKDARMEWQKYIVDFDLTLNAVLAATWLSCPHTKPFMLLAVLPLHKHRMEELSEAAIHDQEYDHAVQLLMEMVSYDEIEARVAAHEQQVSDGTSSNPTRPAVSPGRATAPNPTSSPQSESAVDNQAEVRVNIRSNVRSTIQ